MTTTKKQKVLGASVIALLIAAAAAFFLTKSTTAAAEETATDLGAKAEIVMTTKDGMKVCEIYGDPKDSNWEKLKLYAGKQVCDLRVWAGKFREPEPAANANPPSAPAEVTAVPAPEATAEAEPLAPPPLLAAPSPATAHK